MKDIVFLPGMRTGSWCCVKPAGIFSTRSFSHNFTATGSDGRIYRRVGDSSDPVAESDRHAVDRLYAEGREFSKRFAEFRKDDLVFDDQEHRGWIKIFIAPYPDNVYKKDYLEQEKIADLLRRSREDREIPYYDSTIKMSIPFDAGFPSHKSLILRQVANNPVAANALTAEFFARGWAKILLPVMFHQTFSWDDLGALKSKETREALTAILRRNPSGVESIRLIDVGQLLPAIATLVSFYLDWLGEQPTVTEFRYAIKVIDVRRVAPLIDDDEWGGYLNTHGLPVNGHRDLNIPSRKGYLIWKTGGTGTIAFWQVISFFINYAFGVPEELQSSAIVEWIRRHRAVQSPNTG